MDPEVISVQLFGADVRFTFDDGTSLPVDSAVISRSSVLSDMVSSMDDGDGSELLHTPSGYLVAWLELASSDDQCTHSRSYERLLFSLQVCSAELVLFVRVMLAFECTLLVLWHIYPSLW